VAESAVRSGLDAPLAKRAAAAPTTESPTRCRSTTPRINPVRVDIAPTVIKVRPRPDSVIRRLPTPDVPAVRSLVVPDADIALVTGAFQTLGVLTGIGTLATISRRIASGDRPATVALGSGIAGGGKDMDGQSLYVVRKDVVPARHRGRAFAVRNRCSEARGEAPSRSSGLVRSLRPARLRSS